MKKSISITFLFMFVSLLALNAQYSLRRHVAVPHGPDSIDISYYTKKKPFLAASQVFGLNIGLWAFDYSMDKPYAKINIHTIKENLRHGFVWDNDDMGNNMFLHPYHGNLYFNSARSNGYNYWESGAFTLAGSAMWELFMENEFPSKNDIVATPIGGMAIGEMFYRASDLILDDRLTGSARLGRELASFIITPSQGLSRIIAGDAWRVRSTSGKQFGVPDVSLDIGAGMQITELRDQILDKGTGMALDINMEYGDRFADSNERPFDFSTMQINLNAFGSQPLLSQINILGRLYVTDLIDTEKDFLSIGAYQHFDYFDSDTISDVSKKIPYKFGTPASVGIGLIHQSKRFADWNFNSFFHLNAVLLGASLSDHYKVDQRNYNLASGFSTKGGANLSYKNKTGVSFNYDIYRMFTWKGYKPDIDWSTVDIHSLDAQGDRSKAILHVFNLKVEQRLTEHLYLTGSFYNYIRETQYRYFEDVFSRTSEGRILLTYKF